MQQHHPYAASLCTEASFWCSSQHIVLQEAAFEFERLNYASYQPVNKSVRPRFCKKCQVRPCCYASSLCRLVLKDSKIMHTFV